MATIRETKTGAWEVDFRNKALARRRTFTLNTKEEAEALASQAQRYFDKGLVPPGFDDGPREPASAQDQATLGPLVTEFLKRGQASRSDLEVIESIRSAISPLKLSRLDYDWAEAWVEDMKVGSRNLTPGSIRKRVQALSKVLDWHLRSKGPKQLATNPLKLLPKGYSNYRVGDVAKAKARGLKVRKDASRDRRLDAGEDVAIRAAINGVKRPDRERPIRVKEGAKALELLFEILRLAGARLREAYTLRRGQIDLDRRLLTVVQTKVKPEDEVTTRSIPIRGELFRLLKDWVTRLDQDPATTSDTLLLPFWDGDASDEGLKRITCRLSGRFASLFKYAGCVDLVEHDLRHEATCLWFELRNADGSWMYRSEEIRKIMGWAPNSTMDQRYASFRTESLAERLIASEAIAARS